MPNLANAAREGEFTQRTALGIWLVLDFTSALFWRSCK